MRPRPALNGPTSEPEAEMAEANQKEAEMADDPTPPATGTTNDPPADPTPPADPVSSTEGDPPDDGEGKGGKRAVLADLAKEREQRKALQTEIDELRRAQMSDQEKAVAEAEARGRQAATTEVGERLAAAEIKAALTGVVSDPSAVVEDLALARYLTDDGEVDSEKVKALKTKYEGLTAGRVEAARDRRTREQLGSVPLNTGNGKAELFDMNDWMRRKATQS